LALAADAVQLLLAPFFGEGLASPFNDVLDLVLAALLIRLLGFHWVLLPALAVEVVPGLDLVPTWTASVLLITGGSRRRWFIIAAWITVTAAVALLIWWTHHDR